jgi:hypothetical protein
LIKPERYRRLPTLQRYFINGRAQSPTVAADAGAIMAMMERL